MKGLTGRGLLALLVSLLLVGIVRSAIPENPPVEYFVAADGDGRVGIDGAHIQLVEVSTATRIISGAEFSEATYEASPDSVLVLGRFTIAAHGGPFELHAEVRTPDGYSYESLLLDGFNPVLSVDVGATVTTTLVFEVAADKVAGVLGVHGARPDGLQGAFPVATFRLGDDLHTATVPVVVPPNEVEFTR